MPALADGQVLLRNLYLSIDPAIRGWMDASDSYIEPIGVGEAVRSGVLGEVVESRSERYRPGDRVVGLAAWELYSAVDARALGRVIPADSPVPLPACLSVLGGPGLTAYFGLIEVGQPAEGDTVVVSAAAGAVGSVVGQLAKLQGCRAVGIAGTAAKCAWLVDELGFDAAIDYKTEDVAAALKRACPKGIDIYFDNVGGAMLDAALARLATHGRVVLCGAISTLDSAARPAPPKNYLRLLTKRARMQGFVTLDYADRWEAASHELAEYVAAGRLKHVEHITHGLSTAPTTFVATFHSPPPGKPVVAL